ncbi:MAG: inositol monophosphatase family protein [Polyangiales bacterium]
MPTATPTQATSATFDLEHHGGRQALRALVGEVLAAGNAALRLQPQLGMQACERKPDRSPVTEADRATEARLRRHCQQHFPASVFVGEEAGVSGLTTAPLAFVVDPIDGTRAFVRGMPGWSVLVGLLWHGQPQVGIAYMPAYGELFVAVAGEGAFCNGRPLHVSQIDTLGAAALSHGALLQFADADCTALLPALATATETQRGFADFDSYRNLVLGRVDLVVDPGVKPWDIAAAAVIVQEAGGKLTDFFGKARLDGGGALASNGVLHPALVELVRSTVG